MIEANKAFAAQACAVSRELKLDPAKVNPNGSGIGLGHPIGATGAIITVKALHELQRVGGRYAGDHVHRRRPGHRRDLRTHLSPHCAPTVERTRPTRRERNASDKRRPYENGCPSSGRRGSGSAGPQACPEEARKRLGVGHLSGP